MLPLGHARTTDALGQCADIPWKAARLLLKNTFAGQHLMEASSGNAESRLFLGLLREASQKVDGQGSPQLSLVPVRIERKMDWRLGTCYALTRALILGVLQHLGIAVDTVSYRKGQESFTAIYSDQKSIEVSS